jgi:hypothetical protein
MNRRGALALFKRMLVGIFISSVLCILVHELAFARQDGEE